MRRFVLWTAAGLVSLGAAVVVGGALLPRAHRATSEVVVDVALDRVWPVVSDLGTMPTWWPQVQTASLVTADSARSNSVPTESPGGAEGGGALERWRMVVGGFEMTLEVVEARPPERLVIGLSSDDAAVFGGRWIFELTQTTNGTSVRLTEDGWVWSWPLRTVTWASGYHTSIDDCLVSLGRHFGQSLVPRHLAFTAPDTGGSPDLA